MPIAERIVDSSSSQQRACLQYKNLSNDIVVVEEDTALVDGIGGTTWEGALVLARVLEGIARNADNVGDISHCHVLEVGCGTGLVGLVANSLGFRVTLSDRVADLAESNVMRNSNMSLSASRKRRAFSRDNVSEKNVKHRTQEIMHSVDPDYDVANKLSDALHIDMDRKCDFEESIKVVSLPWGSNIVLQHIQRDTFTSTVIPHSEVKSVAELNTKNLDEIWSVEKLCNERGCVDIVVGAEITCLRKQHSLLVETLMEIARRNPKVIILLTFDGFFNAENPASIYEKEFIERMKALKFRYSLISQAEIHWQTTSENNLCRQAVIISRDFSSATINPLKNSPVFPRPYYLLNHSCNNNDMDVDDDGPSIADIPNQDDDKENVFHHHVLAFYLGDAVHTCQRCHREFFAQSNCRSPSSTGNIFNSLRQSRNKDEGCRFHTGMFVCRRHPAETRCSINGLGDHLGYYGNGVEGWKAEFWDCCGSEDPQCEGCCFDRHISY